MGRLLIALCCGATLIQAADDPWTKVKEIKSGTELRVFKKGSAQPLLVKMDEATDDRLLMVNKNEQTAIDRDQIDRIDARPSGKRPVTKETKETQSDSADPKSTIPGPGSHGGATSTTSTSYSVGGKPDFETVYRRPPPAAKK